MPAPTGPALIRSASAACDRDRPSGTDDRPPSGPARPRSTPASSNYLGSTLNACKPSNGGAEREYLAPRHRPRRAHGDPSNCAWTLAFGGRSGVSSSDVAWRKRARIELKTGLFTPFLGCFSASWMEKRARIELQTGLFTPFLGCFSASWSAAGGAKRGRLDSAVSVRHVSPGTRSVAAEARAAIRPVGSAAASSRLGRGDPSGARRPAPDGGRPAAGSDSLEVGSPIRGWGWGAGGSPARGPRRCR